MEAALIFSLILMLAAGLVLRSVFLMKQVGAAAESLAGQEARYTKGLRPEDLIHLGSFIREWIPGRN